MLRVLAGAYERDPLRPLRLVRLATELDFVPDAGTTEQATRAAARAVTEASPERVFAELRRLVVADRVLDGLSWRTGRDLARRPAGARRSCAGSSRAASTTATCTATRSRCWTAGRDRARPRRASSADLGARVDAELAQAPRRRADAWQALRFAALLHDIAKPQTRGVLPDGRVTFMGHTSVGEEMIDAICRRLRTSERLRTFLGAITRHHLVLGFLVHERPLSRGRSTTT